MEKKRIIVVSADAMVCEDIDRLRRLPNFQRYLAGGCEAVKGMRTIYPSVTYPAHISMITGCWPGMHGVTSNFSFTTSNKDQNWLWFSDSYQVEDIFEAAKKAGYHTASVSWPGTAKNPSVDWLMAEYWMPNPGDTLRSSFRDAGSSEEMLDLIERNEYLLAKDYKKGGKKYFMQWPMVDDFNIHVACDVIREHAPELLFVHTGTFDSWRHAHGVFSPWTEDAAFRLDGYIGQLMDACREAGVLEQTNLVLVSDHGQRDIRRVIRLNVLLADAGLLSVDKDGTVTDWEAFAFSNAMSALIYLKHPENEKLKQRVYDCLKELQQEGVYGVGQVFTAEEAKEQEHLWGGFSFVVESDGYTSFSDAAVRPLVEQFHADDYRAGRATHGYLPDFGPQPVFAAKGPDFCEHTLIERGRVIDEAPTYAKLLGVELKEADGKAMDVFLRQ